MENNWENPTAIQQTSGQPQSVEAAVQQVLDTSPKVDTPAQAKSTTRSALEVAGILLGVLLIVSMLQNYTYVGRFALFIFAGIGVYAIYKDIMRSGRKSEGQSASGLSLARPVTSSADKTEEPSGSKRAIKLAFIVLVIVPLVVYVLPVVGFMLLILFMMILSGGQGPSS